MKRDFEIVNQKISTPFIGEDGNLHYHINNSRRSFLKNKDDEIISLLYYSMIDLGNDHFAVCGIKEEFNSNYDYYDIIKENYEVINLKFKWGIIRINRDENGLIIPGAETMIVPCVYDRISRNNLKTATVYSQSKLTYLDLDIDSEDYGNQLTPCVFEHAVPFDVEYEGFAECSINEVVGYLPRNCKARGYIDSNELLTKEQTITLFTYLKQKDKINLEAQTISAYFNLTGIKLEPEKVKKHRKILN